ncbi:MAG: hypothetical protein QG669_340 [Patescibacteria group bacterium]|nr:hypothetical protein [Patescibacteria group bacterium]
MIFTPHQKEKTARIPPQTPPAGETRIRMPIRKISRGFAETIPPENSFRKTESALLRHLPEYLEGRTPKEKHPFLFQKKIHHRQIRNVRSVFLSGLPRLCEAVAGRFIPRRDCFQNTFELCTMNTAITKNESGIIPDHFCSRRRGSTLRYFRERFEELFVICEEITPNKSKRCTETVSFESHLIRKLKRHIPLLVPQVCVVRFVHGIYF